MSPKHSCPNCAAERSGAKSQCAKCGYPRHFRPTPSPRTHQKIKPFQFDLRTLFACMTISAVTLAALQARDGSALAAALEVGGVFYPVINFFLQFWENIAAARAREAARTRNTSPFVNDSENGEAGEQGDPSPRRTA